LEGGPPIFRQDGSCPALLEDPCPGFPYGAVTRCGAPFQTLPVPKTMATGLFRVRSPLLTESRLMSVPPATEMFQFTGFASCTYEFSTGYPCGWVAPFGDPGITDRSHLPRAFRSVPRPSSPLSAKASTRCPCFALDHRIAVTGDATPPPRTGPNPVPAPQQRRAAVSMKTLLSDKPQAKLDLHHPRAPATLALCRRATLRLADRGLSASVTSQLSLHPSINPAAVARGGVAQSSPNVVRALAQRTGRTSGCSPAAPVTSKNSSPAKTQALARPGSAGGGGERIRTDDLLLAKQALSQLSYTPRARDHKTPGSQDRGQAAEFLSNF
jgi:hypothetical protein